MCRSARCCGAAGRRSSPRPGPRSPLYQPLPKPPRGTGVVEGATASPRLPSPSIPGDPLRKLALVGAGLAVALALPTSALAAQQNSYKVHASVAPTGKASGPASVKFGFDVSETSGLQPSAVKRYTIGF